MIDRSKIPPPTYEELLHLFGEEKAEDILNEVQYNYRAVISIIQKERRRRWYYTTRVPLLIVRIKVFAARNRWVVIYACILAAILVTVYKLLD